MTSIKRLSCHSMHHAHALLLSRLFYKIVLGTHDQFHHSTFNSLFSSQGLPEPLALPAQPASLALQYTGLAGATGPLP